MNFKPPGLKEFIKIAFPLIISQITDNTMFFMDRVFLSNYSDDAALYLNAAFSGGLTMYVTTLFFITVVSYTSTLIAQNYGAKKISACSEFVVQGIILSLIFTPIVIIISLFYRPIFELFNHDPRQLTLELSYSKILAYGGGLVILRSAVVGFFSGIGKTNTIMVVQLIGMGINIPLNYALIFGKGPFPEMGIEGAAFATLVGFAVMDIIFYFIYYSNKWHTKFNTRSFKIDLKKIKQLIKYGSPAGIQGTMGIGVFTYFILVMSGYGANIGTAVTIAINWDSMFFIPMMGLSFATTVLSAQSLGAKNIESARKVLRMSLGVMFAYAFMLGFFILFFTSHLITPFMSSLPVDSPSYRTIYDLANLMLKLVSIYLLADAVQLAMEGFLRGAGDTNAVMFIQISIHITFGLLIYFLAFQQRVGHITAWWIFIGFALTLSIGISIRYFTNKWQNIDLVKAT